MGLIFAVLIGIIFFGGLLFISMIPFLGTLFHSVIVIFTFILMAEGTSSTVMSILMFFTLLLALIDCINDLRITASCRLYHADEVLMNKNKVCAGLPAIGAAVYYFISRQSIQIIVTNSVLLFLAVAPRALFFIAELYASAKIYHNVNNKIKVNDFFKTQEGSLSNLFYCRGEGDYLKLKERSGTVVSNESTIKEEKKISAEKLEKMYPKKLLLKITEIFTGDKETMDKRDRAEKELAVMEEKVSYISKKGFQEFSTKAEELLRQVSSMSPRDFIEKKFPEKYKSWMPFGAEFFLIEAFATGVMKGKIKDESKDDYPMENHAYRHTESSIQVVSRNGNKELALDDDDDYSTSDNSAPQIESIPIAYDKKSMDEALVVSQESGKVYTNKKSEIDKNTTKATLNREQFEENQLKYYNKAVDNMQNKNYHKAINTFLLIDDYKNYRNVKILVSECLNKMKIDVQSNPEYQSHQQTMEENKKYAEYKEPGKIKWFLFIVAFLSLSFLLSAIIAFIVDEATANKVDDGIFGLAVIISPILAFILGRILLKRRIKELSEKHRLYVDAKTKLDALSKEVMELEHIEEMQ